MAFVAHPFVLALILFAISGSLAVDICSEALANLGTDTRPKRAMLRLAALENDVESACLLLQHGQRSVNEVDEYA